jgi:hypothetical protein
MWEDRGGRVARVGDERPEAFSGGAEILCFIAEDEDGETNSGEEGDNVELEVVDGNTYEEGREKE